MEYDVLFTIMRAQPFHNGHVEIIKQAASKAKQVLVFLGSANLARSPKNPLTYAEREEIIHRWSVQEGLKDRIWILPLEDNPYDDDAWANSVDDKIRDYVKKNIFRDGWQPDGFKDLKVGIIGCDKDHTTFYLKMFPQYEKELISPHGMLHATAIRDMLFKRPLKLQKHELMSIVPKATAEFIFDEFVDTSHWDNLREWHEGDKASQEAWSKAPFPNKNVCVDSIVTRGGEWWDWEEVLLIQRKFNPGKDLWALPGGHLEVYEWLWDGSLRELKEETGLVIKDDRYLVNVFDADYPGRSTSGRTISKVYHHHIDEHLDISGIAAADDAKDLRWIKREDIEPTQMFEDHYFLLEMTE